MNSFNSLVLCFVVTLAVGLVVSTGWDNNNNDDKKKNKDCRANELCILCDDFYHFLPSASPKQLKGQKEYKFCQVIQSGAIDVKGNLQKDCEKTFLINVGLNKMKINKILKECNENEGTPQDIGAAHYDCVWKIANGES